MLVTSYSSSRTRELSENTTIYIAANFRGSELVTNTIFAEKTFTKDAMPPNFTEKTFTNSLKTAKFAKVFSFKSFPLYSFDLRTLL